MCTLAGLKRLGHSQTCLYRISKNVWNSITFQLRAADIQIVKDAQTNMNSKHIKHNDQNKFQLVQNDNLKNYKTTSTKLATQQQFST